MCQEATHREPGRVEEAIALAETGGRVPSVQEPPDRLPVDRAVAGPGIGRAVPRVREARVGDLGGSAGHGEGLRT